MFLKFLSKYGLATHLAVLASAPLALMPFLSAAALVTVTFWLCALAAVWIFLEPSLRMGEHLSGARARVRRGIVTDPVSGVIGLAVVFACVRWLNTGIALKFSPEESEWIIQSARWEFLPASTSAGGALPFALTMAFGLVVVGIRHGLGLMARVDFGVTGAFLTGIGGLAACGLACSGNPAFAAMMKSGLGQEPLWTVGFAMWLIIGVTSGLEAEARGAHFARIPFIAGIAGNAAVLVFFMPPMMACIWLVVAGLMLLFSLVYVARVASSGTMARGMIFAVLGFGIPVLLMMMFVSQEIRVAKLEALAPSVAWSEAFKDANLVLSKLAREIWSTHPWSGIGCGAFGIHVPFVAEKADWAVLPPHVVTAYSGYWMILVERGIVGCLILALLLGTMVYVYGARLVDSAIHTTRSDDTDHFVFAAPPVVWTAPILLICLAMELVWSPLLTDNASLLALTSAFALSTASFPKAKRKQSAERVIPKET